MGIHVLQRYFPNELKDRLTDRTPELGFSIDIFEGDRIQEKLYLTVHVDLTEETAKIVRSMLEFWLGAQASDENLHEDLWNIKAQLRGHGT